jgi:hypothetical protein
MAMTDGERDAALAAAEELLEALDAAHEAYRRLVRLDPEGMRHAEAYGMGQHLTDSDRRWTANSLYSEIAEYRERVESGECADCGGVRGECDCETDDGPELDEDECKTCGRRQSACWCEDEAEHRVSDGTMLTRGAAFLDAALA